MRFKIDVEGHEAQVFAEAWATVQKARPLILFESDYRKKDCFSKLYQYEYVLFDADHGGDPGAHSANYVAVRLGSPFEPLVRQYLSNGN
jgi:hypothetical protein